MSAPLPAELYKGSVNAWECDDGGHLNVRFQFERAAIGLGLLAHALEAPRAFTRTAQATLVPLQAHARFLREARAGAPLAMRGGVLGFSECEARVCLDMRHGDNTPATAFTLKLAHASTRDFTAFPWSLRTRAAAERLACVAPAHALPRSLDPGRAAPKACLSRAHDRKGERIGATFVTPDQCDAFGRLRAEHFFGRVSDSVPNFLSEWRAELVRETAARGATAIPAGAVTEARIDFHEWPRPGDLIEVHSAIVEVGEKVMRLCHWLLDPDSGQAWATIQVIALTFDVTTRKTLTPSPELRARMQARAIPAFAE